MAIREQLLILGQHLRARHQRLGRWAWPTWAASVLLTVVAINLFLIVPGPGGIRSAAEMPISTLVYDHRDRPVFSIFKEHRTTVTLKDISPVVIKAVLAVEDDLFYSHYGINVRRMLGATVANVRQGELAQGGSTITQQLARKSFLTDEKSFWRKAREIVLAVKLEWAFSKDEILEMYLNRIYFGRGFHGIEAAAQGYFGKSARTLTLEEASLLVGLIQAPSAYAPPANLKRALARREVVLARMQTVGAITAAEATRAKASTLTFRRALSQPRFGEYFRNRVIRELIDRFGEELVWNGGLRVYTTVDPALQRSAEAALVAGLTSIEQRHGFTGSTEAPAYLQGAFVAIDPRTGHVRALVGGRDFDDSSYDRAVDAQRQAGSAYKPFVFAAALEAGANPSTLLTNLNATTQIPGGEWRPDEAHGVGNDTMTMRQALRVSNNRAAVRVLNNVGLAKAVNYAEGLGLTRPPAVPSMVLGSGEVTLLSMTTAYGAFANGGMVRPPVFVRRVEDREGHLLWQDETESHRAVSQSTAFLMADMLADVMNRGTGARARSEGFRLPAGGKTGTTDDYKDAWFVGFTPTLVAGVWAGFDEPRTIMPGGYATGLVVPIWARFMRESTKGQPATWIETPNNIVTAQVCLRSGLRPTNGCKEGSVGTEYFRAGTEPEDWCPLHGGRGFFERFGIKKAACAIFGC
jgi:1A family penicillin-binding protein